jgi:hypothetical protein
MYFRKLVCVQVGRGTLGGWKTRRHNACQTLLLELADSVGLPVREAGECGTRKRPGEIKVLWFEGLESEAGGS